MYIIKRIMRFIPHKHNAICVHWKNYIGAECKYCGKPMPLSELIKKGFDFLIG
jgi:hypothetical protein